jgi:hypothetical protein
MYQNAIQNDFIAISMSEFTQFGCPYCGYRSSHIPMSQCDLTVDNPVSI